ncbi:MAG: hypothetical protein RDV41_07720, partial [Planctomycetota bacterium]|nr:hypothetical protein [Planctomycetota bacterium]
ILPGGAFVKGKWVHQNMLMRRGSAGWADIAKINYWEENEMVVVGGIAGSISVEPILQIVKKDGGKMLIRSTYEITAYRTIMTEAAARGISVLGKSDAPCRFDERTFTSSPRSGAGIGA